MAGRCDTDRENLTAEKGCRVVRVVSVFCQGNTYLRTRLHPTDREEGGDRKGDRVRER